MGRTAPGLITQPHDKIAIDSRLVKHDSLRSLSPACTRGEHQRRHEDRNPPAKAHSDFWAGNG